jgi:hypothetical protein
MRTDARQPLIRKDLDVKDWENFRFPECGRKIDTIWTDVFTTAVEVTNGRSIYGLASGHLKINQEQTIASFFSQVFPHPVRAKPYRQTGWDGASTSPDIFPKKIAVGQAKEPGLVISFARTVRVPEDENAYDLPLNAGLFPIFSVRDFDSQLPVSMVVKGGLCIPMHGRLKSLCAVVSGVYSDKTTAARNGSDVDPFRPKV